MEEDWIVRGPGLCNSMEKRSKRQWQTGFKLGEASQKNLTKLISTPCSFAWLKGVINITHITEINHITDITCISEIARITNITNTTEIIQINNWYYQYYWIYRYC